MMALGNNTPDQPNSQLTLQPEEALQLAKFILDRAADTAFWARSDAQLVYVNDAACRSLEYSREELLSMTIHEVDPDMPQRVWSELWHTIKQRGSLIFESRHQAKGGQVFPVEINITYAEFQGKAYSCAFARELTKRKQVEITLEANAALTAARLERQDALQQWCATQSQQVPEPLFTDTAKPTVPQSIFSASPQLKKVFQFIEANYQQPITLRDVARAVGYSPAYLTDLMRRQTGRTVNHWITEHRMAEVRSLLLGTNQTVNQIAEAVGYQNEGPFFCQFRQYHGTTPQAWRNTHRTQGSTK